MTTYTASDIEVLQGLEGVRRRPGMYIGGTDHKALHHLVAELLDNAMDEAVAGHADRIEVGLTSDGSVWVKDNGRGIPVDPHPAFPGKSALEVILTTLHSGGKFSSKSYATSGGLNGVGISVVNALSEWTLVEVEREGFAWSQRFARGEPTGPLEQGKGTRRRGTRVTFRPDADIFSETTFDEEVILGMCRTKAYLNRGVTIQVHLALSGRELEFHFPRGLADHIEALCKGKEMVVPDLFVGEVEEPGGGVTRLEWAIAWTQEEELSISSYCNTIPTPLGGTHENALRIALSRAFREYAEARQLLPRGVTITPDDVFGGMVGALSVFLPQPQFSGQTKERLASTRVSRPVDVVVKDHLDHWLHGNPRRATILVESTVERAKDRLSRRRQAQAKRKTITSRLTLPGKLTDCSLTDVGRTELFIVEGDSAGGSAKQARDRETQAILPLRGKILNVEQAGREKFEKNTEIQSLVTAIGTGFGKGFDIEKRRYGRIIIMTDADVDGAHIASLLLTFFYRFMTGLIDAGCLYLAQPPLFRVATGSETIYALDEAEKEALVKRFSRRKRPPKLEISRFKGLGEMDPKQLRETTMSPLSRRLLKVYVDDIEETHGVFERLMGKRPAERFRFIQERASFSRDDLDI